MKLKIVFLSILLLCLFFNIQARGISKQYIPKNQSCTIKLENAPYFLGIRLGMTKSELKEEYPLIVLTEDFPKGSIDRDTPAGIARKSQITNPKYKENIDEISVLFSKENKILTATFIFENSNYGSSLNELSNKFSELLILPKDKWEVSRGGGNGRTLYCDGFAIGVGYTENQKPYLFMAKAPDKLTNSDKEILKPGN